MHIGAKIAFAEDIANFFPSCRYDLIKNIWIGFMGFSDDVAKILTMLTTKDGRLPQGAVTSSFLANLIFWNYEPSLVERLNARGLRYSRYVDDVSVSSQRRLQVSEQSRLIGEIYGMLLHHDFQPKRSKHEVFTSGKSMRTTKLLSNKRVALPPEQRHNIRAAVYALEKRMASGDDSSAIAKELARVASRVGRLGSFHSKEGIALKARLRVIRQALHLVSTKIILSDAPAHTLATARPDTNPPWDLTVRLVA